MYKSDIQKFIDKIKGDKTMKFKTGGKGGNGIDKETYSAEQILNIIKLLEENKLYGIFKVKGFVGITAEGFVTNEVIKNKIKELENKKCKTTKDKETLLIQINTLKELIKEVK